MKTKEQLEDEALDRVMELSQNVTGKRKQALKKHSDRNTTVFQTLNNQLTAGVTAYPATTKKVLPTGADQRPSGFLKPKTKRRNMFKGY
jgi:hypothetical protein